MKYPKVRCLYKYYTYNAHSLSVLINKKVWFSKPATLNDPFDIDIDFGLNLSPSKFERITKRAGDAAKIRALEKDDPNTLDKIIESANNQFREDRKNWGVFCMSESGENILMWSHYADHHKGFCIEFLRSPENNLGNLDMTRPVTYSDVWPAPDPTDQRSYDDLFFTKAKGWEYEKEWRMLNEIGDVLKPLPGDISAVIIGLEMPCDHRATIKNILSKTPEIKYRKTEKVLNQFKLKIVDCESNHGSRKRLPTKRPLSRGKTYPQRGNVLSR